MHSPSKPVVADIGRALLYTAPETWRQVHIRESYLWRMGVLERRLMMRCDVLRCMACVACTRAGCKKPEVLTGRDGDPGRRVGLYLVRVDVQ